MNLQKYFNWHLNTLIKKYNCYYFDITNINIKLLIQTTFRKLLNKTKKFSNNNFITWIIRNVIGFEFWFYVRTFLTLFIAHKIHKKAIITNYSQHVNYFINQNDFDEFDCNIEFETFLWNWKRYTFSDKIVLFFFERYE